MALFILASLYYTNKDFDNALKCYERLCSGALCETTFKHINGDESKIDIKDLEKIKAKSYACICGMYYDGKGVKKDYQKAIEDYKKAANLGDADAYAYLGAMYYKGEGVKQDYRF